MALTVSIKDYPETHHLHFEHDDPLYWFLYPYFERTYNEVGKMIDLYGNAEFFAEELLALFAILESAERDAKTRDETWDVTVGHHADDRKPIVRSLAKSHALDRISALKQMLDQAYNTNRTVLCLGD